MSGSFDDLGMALRMRDTIQRMVREEVDRYRPAGQYGRVIDANRTALNAKVLLNGDIEPITVKMSSLMQPLETDISNGLGNGCMVRVSGGSGNYWIDQIVSGHAYSSGQALASPKLFGGVAGVLDIATHQVVEATLPAVGSTYHVGRWDNTLSSIQDGRGFISIHVRQDLFSGLYKTYEVSLKPNATNSVWQKLPSSTDHGITSGNDFELEIMSDVTGFELRIRRTKDGGGFAPGGYIVSVWAYMDGITYDSTNVGEAVTTAPTRMFNTTTPGDDNGPMLSYGLNFNNRTQFNINGGGLVKMDVTANIFSWTERFVLIGQGRSQLSPSGYYDITQPANGTLIPLYGSTAGTTVTVTTAGIPLQTSQTLYYEVPYGDSATASIATNFRIVAHDDPAQLFTVPSHWIMIATRVISLSQSGDCRLGTGQQLNGPVWDTYTPVVQNAAGSPSNGNATAVGRWRKDGKTVHFSVKFIVGSTTNMGTDNIYFTLPVDMRSASDQIAIGYGHAVRSSPLYRQIFVASSSGVSRFSMVGASSGQIFQAGSSPIPFSTNWANGDTVSVMGTYECDS